MDDFARDLPKAELHLHIEGTLEPGLAFDLAERNGVDLPWDSVDELTAAYDFDDLVSFLDVYERAMVALRTREDFRDLTRAYVETAASQGLRHAEVFFDPQAHLERDVDFDAVVAGIRDGLDAVRADLGVTSRLIMCFLRDRTVDAAERTLDLALDHVDAIDGVGLDSAEVGNPPSKFADVYARARDAGFLPVAHAGEEGPPAYVREALDLLEVRRIDHGNRALEDDDLVARLVDEQVPLTVCPLSNIALKVVDRLEDHPLPRMLDLGLNVCVNSDDPAYFGGYIGDNYAAVQDVLGIDRGGLVTLARNSVRSSFADEARKQEILDEIDAFAGAM